MNTSALTDDIDASIDSSMFQSIMFISEDRHHILLYINENKMRCIGVDQCVSANIQKLLSKFFNVLKIVVSTMFIIIIMYNNKITCISFTGVFIKTIYVVSSY